MEAADGGMEWRMRSLEGELVNDVRAEVYLLRRWRNSASLGIVVPVGLDGATILFLEMESRIGLS